MRTFTLADICRAKTIPVEIKDDSGNVEGIVYLKEPSAVEGAKLQESIATDRPWYEVVMGILALTLSDENGNLLATSPADRKNLESMPPRMLIALRDPCLEMLSLSWSSKDVAKKEVIDIEDVDATLANLDDQIASTYSAESMGDEAESQVAIPIDGNENLHLDQGPGTADTPTALTADPTNPFVETPEVHTSPV